jgi:hypothetical protein
MRSDTDALQRQNTSVIVDPSGATGDPSNNYAVIVSGWLKPITAIAAWGLAVWNQATSTWVQINSSGGTSSSTVVAPQTPDVASTAGAASAYSRGDHSHGTPQFKLAKYLIGGSGSTTLAGGASSSTNLSVTTPASVLLRTTVQIPVVAFSADGGALLVTLTDPFSVIVNQVLHQGSINNGAYFANHLTIVGESAQGHYSGGLFNLTIQNVGTPTATILGNNYDQISVIFDVVDT